MTEATKSTRTITTTEESYTLKLSAEEFAWLKDLIGGQPAEGISAAVWKAMLAPGNGDTFTYEGVEYDLTATYKDPSNDLWGFTGARDANGEPLISCLLEDASSRYQDWPLSRLVETYSYGRGLRRA